MKHCYILVLVFYRCACIKNTLWMSRTSSGIICKIDVKFVRSGWNNLIRSVLSEHFVCVVNNNQAGVSESDNSISTNRGVDPTYYICCSFNPLTLRVAKTGLTILLIFSSQKRFIKNIWKRNVYQNNTNNSPSNILREFALFSSYFQKYENSRQHFPAELWVWMG